MKMGFGMDGIEDRIEFYAKDIASRFNEVTYIEIGVAEGATLSAVALTLKNAAQMWRAIGIELVNGYSFNRSKTEAVAFQRGLQLNFVIPNCSVVHPLWEAVTVYF